MACAALPAAQRGPELGVDHVVSRWRTEPLLDWGGLDTASTTQLSQCKYLAPGACGQDSGWLSGSQSPTWGETFLGAQGERS